MNYDEELMMKDLKFLNNLKDRIVTLINYNHLNSNEIDYVNEKVFLNFYDITVLDLFKLADIFQISVSELCDIDGG